METAGMRRRFLAASRHKLFKPSIKGTDAPRRPNAHGLPRYTTPAGSPTPRAIPVAANTIRTINIVWITLKRA
ncbi:hypothetical protein BCh11DRAFT_05770 [Burkholderia sp. Ch1-1]|nr:hypothetical protein BCh11DRAFT_05770 [Burkholderia sp. Ch1-1]